LGWEGGGIEETWIYLLGCLLLVIMEGGNDGGREEEVVGPRIDGRVVADSKDGKRRVVVCKKVE